MTLRIGYFFVLFLLSFSVFSADVEQYFPENQEYIQEISKPRSILGFGIGERHVRHDQLLNYFDSLVKQSERVLMTEIGRTNELRRQVLITISTPENLSKLPELLNQNNVRTEQDPIVVWLGYSVHGDEISGSNASMAVAYHLAASQKQSVMKMLENTIIVMEPSVNPDGMDRFVNWVNTHRGTTANADANHIEHHQGWRTGRTNHFGFDLNRDWLLLAQKETKNRLPYFHRYQPHVLSDFHEMGANSSYFFQPGIPTRTHPLTPESNTKLTRLLATYHGAALDTENRLYYSEESFDDFYYGKGSTYPDINGGIGILFEQASSRGFQQESINGLLTFEYGIKNHVLTSLSTIEGAWKNADELRSYRKQFYKDSLKSAKKEAFSGYLLSEQHDSYRLSTLLSKLNQHQIKVYPLVEDFRLDGKEYAKETSFYIPLEQKQYRLIKALFDQGTNFKDNTFYDVSGWTMPLAMDIDFYRVGRTWGLELAKQPWQEGTKQIIAPEINAYAYAFDWSEYLAPKLLNQLLSQGIQAKVATKTFSSIIDGQNKEFAVGTIVIPAAIQTNNQWRKLLSNAGQQNAIDIYSIDTGLTITGVDIGSGSNKPVKPVKTLLIGGKSVSQYEAGEVLYYLDDTLNIPVSVVELARLSRVDLSTYTHIVMVDGRYDSISENNTNKIKSWLKAGGVVFAQKRAAKWLSEKSLLNINFVSKKHIDQLFDTEGLAYQDKEKLSARKRIAGAIFETQLDTSHPLTYGYKDSKLPIFRNSTLIMEQTDKPFMAVANYTAVPLMSGYTDRNLINKIANQPAIVSHNYGRGRVIATADNLTFRGYWLGSAKLLANSLFFAKAFSTPTN